MQIFREAILQGFAARKLDWLYKYSRFSPSASGVCLSSPAFCSETFMTQSLDCLGHGCILHPFKPFRHAHLRRSFTWTAVAAEKCTALPPGPLHSSCISSPRGVGSTWPVASVSSWPTGQASASQLAEPLHDLSDDSSDDSCWRDRVVPMPSYGTRRMVHLATGRGGRLNACNKTGHHQCTSLRSKRSAMPQV